MTFLRFLWKMRLSNCGPVITHSTSSRSCLCNLFRAAAVLCVVFFIGTAFVATNHKERISRWRPVDSVVTTKPTRLEKISRWRRVDSVVTTKPTRLESVSGLGPVYSTDAIKSNKCKNHCKPFGSESLPTGIVSRTSDLEMQLLGGPSKQKRDVKTSKSLLAIAVGLKQKNNVDQIVKKFPSSGFSLMLFHYDGAVNEWRDLQWSQNALHVSAINQTKWWFAKRFLHPDIVAEYSYIFLWDEDLGVEHFDPGRYLSIVQEEGLEISQPALDQTKSEVHHQITVRSRRKKVHRRIYKFTGGGRCYENSTGPPCTGWVEMMAPVFSKAAWRCAWYMIQNDLIHAWGLDTKLGYCAQGDRTKNVGVVDAEYIVHQGIPTLGGSDKSKSNTEAHTHPLQLRSKVPPSSGRYAVRIRSYEEQKIFKQRWEKAVAEDKCWIDPYSETRRT